MGNGRVASICTSAPFPPLDTYPPLSNVLSNIRASSLRHCPNIFMVRHVSHQKLSFALLCSCAVLCFCALLCSCALLRSCTLLCSCALLCSYALLLSCALLCSCVLLLFAFLFESRSRQVCLTFQRTVVAVNTTCFNIKLLCIFITE